MFLLEAHGSWGLRDVCRREEGGVGEEKLWDSVVAVAEGERLRAAASTYVALSLAVAGVQKTRQAWFESGVEW